MDGGTPTRIGHKGADAIAPGNTLESFEAAVEAGAEMIELDVLRVREGRLVIAHDHHDALTRRPLELGEALDAFLEPPLDQVELDFDLKLPGREAELAGALAGHGLLERAMVSTMEIPSLIKLRTLEPDLRLGWTFPKTRRDWTSYRWAAPAVATALAGLQVRFPRILAKRAPQLGVDAVWAYHRVVTRRLVAAARKANVKLIAWTVDDPARIARLTELGVDGICTNDPRLFGKPADAAAEEQPAAAGADADGDGTSPEEAAEVVEELAEDGKPAAKPAPKGDGRKGGKRGAAEGGSAKSGGRRAAKPKA